LHLDLSIGEILVELSQLFFLLPLLLLHHIL
jgi:hypothetical protein